jgi:hypothetical protein
MQARAALLGLCIGLFAWHPATATQRWEGLDRPTTGTAGASFAIADFDGDSKPDLATVQPGPAMAARTNYWIHLEFSLGNHGSFAVVAPAGGLQIASRDVNGDSFLDLIISTSIANQPVAVLLNDGRGNFTLAKPGAFGAAIWQARKEWRAAFAQCSGNEGALGNAGWRGGICESGVGAELPPAMPQAAIDNEKLQPLDLPDEFRGRAPPAA